MLSVFHISETILLRSRRDINTAALDDSDSGSDASGNSAVGGDGAVCRTKNNH